MKFRRNSFKLQSFLPNSILNDYRVIENKTSSNPIRVTIDVAIQTIFYCGSVELTVYLKEIREKLLRNLLLIF